MDTQIFRSYGKDLVDYICNYHEKVNNNHITPSRKLNYLKSVLPDHAPEHPEEWLVIMEDLDKHIMKRVIHWRHYQYFGCFPRGDSYSSLMGNMLTDAIGDIPNSLEISPASYELESIMMDWLAKAMNLPKEFLNGSTGCGILQNTKDECIFNSILAARNDKLKEYARDDRSPYDILQKLVIYCSDEAHIGIKVAAKQMLIKQTIISTNNKDTLWDKSVKQIIEADIKKGLIPLILFATLGTNSSAAVDNLQDIGAICKHHKIWFHVDAAYAGFSLICPEMRNYAKGIEYADSFNANPDMWLHIHPDCACLWVKDKSKLCSVYDIDPNSDPICKTQRFKALKIWLTLRGYGLSGMREYIRKHVKLAQHFKTLLLQNDYFEVMNEVIYGLVCFRIKNVPEEINKKLFTQLNETELIHLTSDYINNNFVIKYCITKSTAKEQDINTAFQMIAVYTEALIKLKKEPKKKDAENKCTCLDDNDIDSLY